PRLVAGLRPPVTHVGVSGAGWAASLPQGIERLCDAAGLSRVTNGRFKGGYTTRHYGGPEGGVHAVQMELACRGYLREPLGEVDEANWPCAWDEGFAAPMRAVLERVLTTCIRLSSWAPC